MAHWISTEVLKMFLSLQMCTKYKLFPNSMHASVISLPHHCCCQGKSRQIQAFHSIKPACPTRRYRRLYLVVPWNCNWCYLQEASELEKCFTITHLTLKFTLSTWCKLTFSVLLLLCSTTGEKSSMAKLAACLVVGSGCPINKGMEDHLTTSQGAKERVQGHLQAPLPLFTLPRNLKYWSVR